MTDEPEDDNVVPLHQEGGPVLRKPKPVPRCHHLWGVWVDEDDRQVTCRRCAARLDPFDALNKIASRWDFERSHDALNRMGKEAEALQKQIDRLKASRAKERRAGYVRAELVRVKFAGLVKWLRSTQNMNDRVTAARIEETVKAVLEAE